MKNFERTKFIGAATATLLGVMVLGLGAEAIFHMDELEEPAYAVDVPEELAGSDTGVEEPVINLAALIATADPIKGEKVAKKCAACHAFEKGGANKTGPALWGVMGADIASHAGYSYSGALEEKEGVWDWEKMSAFLEKPRQWAPGTKMGFAGLSKPEDRADIMAWMNEQGDNVLPKPEVVEEEPDPVAEVIAPTTEEANDGEPVENAPGIAVSEPGDGQAVPATGENALDPDAPGPDGITPESPEKDMGGAEPDALPDGDAQKVGEEQPQESDTDSDTPAAKGQEDEPNATPDFQQPLREQSPSMGDPESPDAAVPVETDVKEELPENAT